MNKLNNHAKSLTEKYIRKTTPSNYIETRKKRGVQAEVNKLEAIRRGISDSKTVIDYHELIRLRNEIAKLGEVVDVLIRSSGS